MFFSNSSFTFLDRNFLPSFTIKPIELEEDSILSLSLLSTSSFLKFGKVLSASKKGMCNILWAFLQNILYNKLNIIYIPYRLDSANELLDVTINEVFGFRHPLPTVLFVKPLNSSTAISSSFSLLQTSSTPKQTWTTYYFITKLGGCSVVHALIFYYLWIGQI